MIEQLIQLKAMLVKLLALYMALSTISIPLGGVRPSAGVVSLPDSYEAGFAPMLPNEGANRVRMAKDRPKITLSRWSDEVALGVEYKKITANAQKPVSSDKVRWGAGSQVIHAYKRDTNNFEIELELKSKPATNKFDFTITGAENLDFFYQPELTAEEIAEGASRPENVVGSYAVYHKTKKDHVIGRTNYGTGKTFHIYRPKAIDANGVEAWADLSYTNGVLSVIVPQGFLDSAAYPVVVDPTFGYTTIGGTNSSLGFNTVRIARNDTPSESGTLDSVSFYLTAIGAFTYKIRGVLYTDSTLALVGDAGTEQTATTVGTENEWVTMTMPNNSFTGGTAYAVGVWIGNANWNSAKYDVGSRTLGRDDLVYATTGNPNDPFVVDSSLASRDYSIYATYTATGGTTTSVDQQIIIIN